MGATTAAFGHHKPVTVPILPRAEAETGPVLNVSGGGDEVILVFLIVPVFVEGVGHNGVFPNE